MKLDRTEAWWLRRADREGDAAVGAGVAALNPAGEMNIGGTLGSPVSTLAADEAAPTSRPNRTLVLSEEGQPRGAVTASGSSPVDDTRIAFGRFVEFMRRSRGLSIEQLAAQADLDAGELILIEDDLHYTPEPRTVYQLALTFSVRHQRLLQLAGLTEGGGARLRQDAVRFAARAESVQKLSKAERAALEEFVAALSAQDG